MLVLSFWRLPASAKRSKRRKTSEADKLKEDKPAPAVFQAAARVSLRGAHGPP